MDSKKVPFGKHCAVIKGLSYKGEFIHKKGPALLGIGTIKQDGGFRPENVRTYGGPYKPEHVLNPGDVYVALTSQDGLLIGSTAMVPKDFNGFGITTHHDAKINWKTNDPLMRDFLFWIMHTRDFMLHCINFSVGTTVYATSPKDVEIFEVPEKLNSNQIIMTRTLNKFREIENNIDSKLKVIKSSMESLFRSWFIDFDIVNGKFNGDLDADIRGDTIALFPESFEDSELGLIPAGWSLQYLADLYDVKRGFSYSSALLCNNKDSTPMINLASFFGGGGYKKSGLKYISSKPDDKFLIRKGDVCLATVDLTPDLRVVGGPLIVPSILNNKAIFSQDLLRLRNNSSYNLGRGYLFFWLKMRRGVLMKWANGTTVSRFPPNALNYLPVLIPPKKVLDEFSNIFEISYALIETLESIKTNIYHTRNSLLQNLMSGEFSGS